MNQMGKMLKQAQKMQEKMKQMEQELSESLIEVETAGGAVVINITGDGILNSIKINPDVVDKNDVEGLEDLILTGVNHAISEARKFSEEKSSGITQGLNLPKGFKF